MQMELRYTFTLSVLTLDKTLGQEAHMSEGLRATCAMDPYL